MGSSEEGHPDEGAGGLDELRRAVEEERQKNIRLLADFDNFKRRVARDKNSGREEGRREALLPLLPVLETLEKALAAGSSDAAFLKGVAATHRLFLNALREAGAEPIETVGVPFDPRVHEVVATVTAEEVEPGTVVSEARRGWRIGDELLRPAQVEIAAPREAAEPWR